MGGSGGGDETDVFEFGGLGEFFVGAGFVGWQVEDEDAIGTGHRGIVMEGFEAVGVNGIEVSEEHDGDFGMLAEILHQLEGVLCRGAGIEGTLSSALDDGAVGEGVGEGNSEFDDINTGGIKGAQDFRGLFETRVSRADLGDEGGFTVSMELGEGGVDSIGHGWPGGTMWGKSAGLATLKLRGTCVGAEKT